MNRRTGYSLLLSLLLAFGNAAAQDADIDIEDMEITSEDLKIAAIEALMSAPADKALPIVLKVLDRDSGEDLKEAALFILSQMDDPAAQAKMLELARNDSGELRLEAIRMIGIGGNDDSLASLRELFAAGDQGVKEAVLEAYLIAGDAASVYAIAANAADPEVFEAAVDILGAMDARAELRKLRDSGGACETLIDAYAVAGDVETLNEMARDRSDSNCQVQAIEGLGIVGGPQVDEALVEIYRNAESGQVREAALDGMLIAGHDEGVLLLYRESRDNGEKRDLLDTLSAMGSDLLFDVIDEALAGDR